MASLAPAPGRTTLPDRPWRPATGPTKATGRPVKILRWLAAALIAVGVLGRLLRYLLPFPIWGDEAFVCFNLLHRDFAGLTHGLEYSQVAPILFLWGERAAVGLLGYSEHAMRLLPLLAGLASLALFWRLARSTVPPLAAMIAVGLLAAARWPVSMSTFVKPYSGDLLMALVLLVPAVEWLRRPEQLRWLVVLALVVPVALGASYPAVFVAGAVSLALLPTAWRSGWAGRGLFVAYNLLVAASFLGTYLLVGRAQIDPGGGAVNQYLQTYWSDSFPPTAPWPLLKWLALAHTGQMMAYPFGGSDGLSTITFLLFAFGAWTWWKGGRRPLLVLWLAPFALNLLAAALHRYPYGGSCRLCQHLAPAVCLLAGTGIAALVERFVPSESLRLRWAVWLCVVLGGCAVGGMVCDVVYPYRDPETRWLADMPGKILAQLQPGEEVVVAQDRYGVPPTFRWYMESQDRDAQWQGQIDWERMADRKSLTTVNVWVHPSRETVTPPTFEAPAAHGWTAAQRTPYATRGGNGEWTFHVEVCRWVPPR